MGGLGVSLIQVCSLRTLENQFVFLEKNVIEEKAPFIELKLTKGDCPDCRRGSSVFLLCSNMLD